MRTGPKALIGLGAPAALRAITLSKGVGMPWRAFGGAALRVGGLTLRVNSKPIVVEPNA